MLLGCCRTTLLVSVPLLMTTTPSVVLMLIRMLSSPSVLLVIAPVFHSTPAPAPLLLLSPEIPSVLASLRRHPSLRVVVGGPTTTRPLFSGRK